MEAISFIGLLSLTHLFVEGAAPVQYLKRLANIHNDQKPETLTKQVIQALVNCAMCSGFWFGLFFYLFTGHDHFFLAACTTAIAAELFTRLIRFLFNNKPFNAL